MKNLWLICVGILLAGCSTTYYSREIVMPPEKIDKPEIHEKIRKHVEKIVIPEVNIQNMKISDLITEFVDLSRIHDEEKCGISVIYMDGPREEPKPEPGSWEEIEAYYAKVYRLAFFDAYEATFDEELSDGDYKAFKKVFDKLTEKYSEEIGLKTLLDNYNNDGNEIADEVYEPSCPCEGLDCDRPFCDYPSDQGFGDFGDSDGFGFFDDDDGFDDFDGFDDSDEIAEIDDSEQNRIKPVIVQDFIGDINDRRITIKAKNINAWELINRIAEEADLYWSHEGKLYLAPKWVLEQHAE